MCFFYNTPKHNIINDTIEMCEMTSTPYPFEFDYETNCVNRFNSAIIILNEPQHLFLIISTNFNLFYREKNKYKHIIGHNVCSYFVLFKRFYSIKWRFDAFTIFKSFHSLFHGMSLNSDIKTRFDDILFYVILWMNKNYLKKRNTRGRDVCL